MLQITVLLLDQMFSSTAIGPMEVFRHAGSLWNILTGMKCVPSFHVTTASADGRPVDCDGDIQIKPNVALRDVGKTDLIFVPTTGLSVDDVVERNAPIVPWLKRRSGRGVAVASVCSGVGLVAAAGLLDGKRATTHWGLAERFREKYPRVKWMPELMVTEDRESAVDRNAARLAVGFRDRTAQDRPHRRRHFERAGMDAQEFCQDLSAGRPGAARGHELAQFCAAIQARYRGQPLDLSAEAAGGRGQADAREQPSHHAGDQRR